MKTYTPEMIREEMQGEFTLVIAKYEDEEKSSLYLIPTINDCRNGRVVFRAYRGVNAEAGKKIAEKLGDFDSNLTTLDMIDYELVKDKYLVEKNERREALR